MAVGLIYELSARSEEDRAHAIRVGASVSVDGAVFLPATEARRVVALSPLQAVFSYGQLEAGVALANGAVVTVLAFRFDEAAPAQAVLCEIDGQPIAVAGGRVRDLGDFEEAEGGVMADGVWIPTLNLRALYAKTEARAWASRAGGALSDAFDDAGIPSSQPPRMARKDDG